MTTSLPCRAPATATTSPETVTKVAMSAGEATAAGGVGGTGAVDGSGTVAGVGGAAGVCWADATGSVAAHSATIPPATSSERWLIFLIILTLSCTRRLAKRRQCQNRLRIRRHPRIG